MFSFGQVEFELYVIKTVEIVHRQLKKSGERTWEKGLGLEVKNLGVNSIF